MSRTRRYPGWPEWSLEDVLRYHMRSPHNNPHTYRERINARRIGDGIVRINLRGKIIRKATCGPYPNKCVCCIATNPRQFRAIQRRLRRAKLKYETQRIVREELAV